VIYKRIDIGADEWANPPDYNLDGFVNFIDYSMFAQAWLTEDSVINLDEELIVDENDLFMFAECWAWSAYRSKADLNSDNIVNFRDFAMFSQTWDSSMSKLFEFCKDWLWVFTWD